MCGFSGYFSKQRINLNNKSHHKVLKHRGPDSSGSYENKKINYFKIVFNRLSILDLKERSNQPFRYKHLILCFNGEIYNYLSLKKKLEKIGYNFDTSSDTEVLIKGIYHFGLKKVLSFMEGMWAFSLYNEKNEELILCRDRFGEKPLYFYEDKNKFFFGSEIRSIKFLLKNKIKFNEKYIQKYLFYDYRVLNSDNNEIFEKLQKVLPGQIIKINKKFTVKKYSYLKIVENNVYINRNNVVKKIKNILNDAVKNSLNSERKLAFTLSGGVDSTGLVSIAKRKYKTHIKTFTIFSNDKKYNEFDNVKKTIKKLKLNHSWIKIDKNKTFLNLKKILPFRMSPMPTYTSYIQWLMFKEIAKQNYKVIISGNGSDEMFSGYYDHYLAHLNDLKNKKYTFEKNLNYWEKHIAPLIRNPNFKNLSFYKKNYVNILSGNNISKKFSKKSCSFSLLNIKKFKSLLKNRMHNELFYESVPVLLTEEDLNAMYFSIENRSPYLNNKLHTFLRTLNSELYINKGMNKSLLRDCIKNIAPKHIIKDYEKIGFNISIDKLIDFKSSNMKNFITKNSKIFNYVKKNEILKILEDNKEIQKYSNFLFKFINMKILIDAVK